MTLSPAVRPLLTPAILIGVYVVLVTLTKDLQQIWPIQAGEAGWRFGALGFLIGSGALPVVGTAMVVLAGVLAERPLLTRVTGFLAIGLGLVMLVGLVVFLVDSRTLLATATGDATTMLQGAVRRTATVGVFTGLAYLALGAAAVRAAAGLTGLGAPGKPSGLVVGA